MDLVTKIRERVAAWLDRRRAPRRCLALRAFYWDGAQSAPHDVRDISGVGAYIVTEIKWYLGTMVDLTLEPGIAASSNGHRPALTHRISAVVTRAGEDGIAVEFLHKTAKQRRAFERLLKQMGDEHQNNTGKRTERGQSLLEFALILPLLLLLIVNVVNFGAFFYAWITIANAARAGAQYYAMGGATIGSPATPSASQVTTVVTNDAGNLPNAASLQVRVCTNNNGTTACSGTGYSLAPPADPEPSSYVLMSVDVSYTYQPVIAAFDFPGLGIHATLPRTSMHRRAVMRSMQ